MAKKKKKSPPKSAKKAVQKAKPSKRTSTKSRPLSQNARSLSPSLLIGLLAILLLGLWAYWPSLDGEFTSWDDEEYVLLNQSIHELNAENIAEIFKTPIQGNYHPLTMLSLGISYEQKVDANGKGQVHPRKGYPLPKEQAFHWGNLILHLMSTLILGFFIFFLFGGKWIPAVFVAGIFALHPMHVESVAWITGRKDVLYGLFFISGLWAYLAYLRQKSYLFLGLSFVLFSASLLSKPAAVAFPLILIVLDLWEGRKFSGRMMLEKLPFFIGSLIIGMLTVRYQSVDAIGDWERFSLWERIMYASHSFVGYILKFFYPEPLKIFYPYPKFGDPPLATQLAPLAALFILVASVLLYKRNRFISLGLFFYLATIALVLQFVSVGGAIMAERYTYIPYIGLSLPIAWFLNQLIGNTKSVNIGRGVTAMAFAALILFSWLSRERTPIWQNGEALYSSVLEIHPNLHGMLLNRGNYYLDLNQYDKALSDYNRAIEVKPKDSDALFNVALIHNYKRDFEKAVEMLDRALALNKGDYSLYASRGDNYKELGKFRKAIGDYTQAIQLYDRDALPFLNRGICFFSINKAEEARRDFIRVTELQPNSPEGFNNVGYLLLQQEDFENSRKYLEQALQIDADNVNALSNMAIYHGMQGQKAKARKYIEKLRAMGNRVDQVYLENLIKQYNLQ